ncbi:hypothetical protein FCM35_KLT10242 [Carex littledalei]|uniref:Uncharacterized protein n=1 Tax=Carex littledalei TaxID=544730 RepID=A0A833QNM6_9POAL|nr:hypothetical protein FCM35_KLT10242 [Carex littledalei]
MPFISNPSISNSSPKKPPSLGLAEALDDDQHDLFNSPKKDRRMLDVIYFWGKCEPVDAIGDR